VTSSWLFYSSVITVMHGAANIKSFTCVASHTLLRHN